MAIRLALLGHHYRSDHMWGSHEIPLATAFIDRLRLNLARPEVADTDCVVNEIIACLASDLDTCGVLSALERWCDKTEQGSQGGSPGELSRVLDDLLGIAL
jgi:L-cysteine:1D-myo-inositol 2-amino-2-deoxy-alpha-D-glucopyranoside ligase